MFNAFDYALCGVVLAIACREAKRIATPRRRDKRLALLREGTAAEVQFKREALDLLGWTDIVLNDPRYEFADEDSR